MLLYNTPIFWGLFFLPFQFFLFFGLFRFLPVLSTKVVLYRPKFENAVKGHLGHLR